MDTPAPGKTGSFKELMARLKSGDSQAAQMIFRKYSGRLIGLARSHLHAKLQAKVDPEDVVQSAMNSFFSRNTEQNFALNDWNELWSLLVTITLRKCGKQADYYHAAKRDVRTEVSRSDDSIEAWEAIARDPSPMEALLLSDLVERIMSQLEPRQKEILDCCLQGMNVEQIRQQVGCSERTVFRTLERVSKHLCMASTA